MAENRCSFVFYENYMDAVRHQPSEELRKELLYEIWHVAEFDEISPSCPPEIRPVMDALKASINSNKRSNNGDVQAARRVGKVKIEEDGHIITDLLNQGYSRQQLADYYGCSTSTISHNKHYMEWQKNKGGVKVIAGSKPAPSNKAPNPAFEF